MTDKPDLSVDLKRHPDALAWDEFLKNNRGLSNAHTLGISIRSDEFLRNRLRRAFEAGIEHGRTSSLTDAQIDRIAKKAAKRCMSYLMGEGADVVEADGEEMRQIIVSAIKSSISEEK